MVTARGWLQKRQVCAGPEWVRCYAAVVAEGQLLLARSELSDEQATALALAGSSTVRHAC